MPADLTPLLESWEGLGAVVRFDRPSGAWIFIAVHDDSLGPSVGGCRMHVYPGPADGLRDAMRLAEGMTHKWAALGMPFGGGKSVLAVPRHLEGADRRGLLERFGRLVESLRGTYRGGQDLGTTPEDMMALGASTRWVLGLRNGEIVDPGPYTALGVFEGIGAALRAHFGDDRMAGRTVLIQGAGDVGRPLARQLAEAGATVLVSDVDVERAAALAAETGGRTVAPDEVYTTPCDVFAPCAIGAILDATTIPRLACQLVAGSANNQLATAGDADRLHARDILYAPDYVINGGGAVAFGSMALGEVDDGTVRARITRIGASLDEIFAEAAERDESPLHAARRRVDRVLATARSRRQDRTARMPAVTDGDQPS